MASRIFMGFLNSVKPVCVFWVEEARRIETRSRRIAEVDSLSARDVKPTYIVNSLNTTNMVWF